MDCVTGICNLLNFVEIFLLQLSEGGAKVAHSYQQCRDYGEKVFIEFIYLVLDRIIRSPVNF